GDQGAGAQCGEILKNPPTGGALGRRRGWGNVAVTAERLLPGLHAICTVWEDACSRALVQRAVFLEEQACRAPRPAVTSTAARPTTASTRENGRSRASTPR